MSCSSALPVLFCVTLLLCQSTSCQVSFLCDYLPRLNVLLLCLVVFPFPACLVYLLLAFSASFSLSLLNVFQHYFTCHVQPLEPVGSGGTCLLLPATCAAKEVIWLAWFYCDRYVTEKVMQSFSKVFFWRGLPLSSLSIACFPEGHARFANRYVKHYIWCARLDVRI